jgi:hypothetical protein
VALAMQEVINAEAVDGWEYLRTDLVPVEEKAGFLSRTREVHRAVLIFRRETGTERPARSTLSAHARSLAETDEPEPEISIAADPRELREGRIALSAERRAPPLPRTGRPPTGLG